MARHDELGRERRQYIRLDTVFPVQFRLESLDGKSFYSGWLQGFTNNIGKGGLCLTVNNFEKELATLVATKQVKISLEVEIPITRKPVRGKAAVAWVKHILTPDKYLIGLTYETIDPQQNTVMFLYTRAKKIFVPLVAGIIALLAFGIALNVYVNAKLVQGNKALVGQLVQIVQDSAVAKQKVKQIGKEREDLQTNLHALELRIKTVEDGRESSDKKKLKEQDALIEQLTTEKDVLQQRLIAVQQNENAVTEELLRLDKRKAFLQKENFDKMYQWLTVHQNPRTGLVMSFEGDTDVAGWGFMYDQSLAAQAYTYFSDYERARKIFDFFKDEAKRESGLSFNAYYVTDGVPAEYVVHTGPNIWLGIAIAHYTKKTQDTSYLPLAEEIAQALIHLQSQDAEGGLRGGPNQTWYSTEHNLDAYAFFTMLHTLTSKPQYQEAADKILSWLVKNTYNRADLPVARGKGDATIATDTYAWSIAAIGPRKLEELGLNPDRIIEFAEQKCAVEVPYTRPEGETVQIRGFDFAAQKNLARGGIVSSEWTAQMVIAYKKMSDFYYKKDMSAKSRAYALKADDYLLSLVNMIISSPSPSGQGEGCIPYATQDFVDTGHGWMTPKGGNTGSVAGTAYTLFAYYNYNPLELQE